MMPLGNRMPAMAFFVLAWLIVACPIPGQAQKNLSFVDIPASAKTASDQARVIVVFSVPNLTQLHEASRQYKVTSPDATARGLDRSAAVEADRALSRAIGTSADAVLGRLAKGKYSLKRRYNALPAVALTVDSQALASLQDDPNVVSVEPDVPAPLPEPIPAPSQAGQAGQTGTTSLDAPSAETSLIGAAVPWGLGYTGSGWYVAILDTGIRSTHTFFSGKTIVEACFSAQADCPNSQTSMYGPGAAAHYPDTYEGWDHGTHVAGIAAGRDTGSLSGVAKEAAIIAVNVFSKIFDGAYWVGSYPSDQLAGLDYVYSLRTTYSIGAVNMSLGSGSFSAACDSANSSLKQAIDQLAAVDIAVAIASGNSAYTNSISAPACISTAVSVGASNSSDLEAWFSNYNPTLLDIFAPGVSVNSSTGASDNSFEQWDGTSMATPHVAGSWVLLRQKYPATPVSQLLSTLKSAGASVALKAGDAGGGNVRRIKLGPLFASAVPVDITPSLVLLLQN